MAFLKIPELNTRMGTYRAYHLAAIILSVSLIPIGAIVPVVWGPD